MGGIGPFELLVIAVIVALPALAVGVVIRGVANARRPPRE
jgi:hypothetical protein